MFSGLKFKVFFLGLLGLVGLAVVGSAYFVGDSMQSKMINLANGANNYAAKALKLDVDLLTLRHSEKDFLSDGDLRHVQYHSEQDAKIDETLKDIKTVAETAGQTAIAEEAAQLIELYDAYQRTFEELVAARTELGLVPSEGLEGRLRNSVRAIEEKLSSVDDPQLTALMLTLRRHEKDFMLRRDTKYVEAFEGSVQDFSAQMSSSYALSDTDRNDVSNFLVAYERDFIAWAKRAADVSNLTSMLSEHSGKMVVLLDAMVADIQKVATIATNAQISISNTMYVTIAGAIAAASLIILALSFLIGRAIVKPLGMMTSSMSSLAHGNLDIEIDGAQRKDEIGQMAVALGVFKENAVANRRMNEEAEANRQRAEAERIAMQEKAETDAAERLRVATAGLAAGLKRLAAGDLSVNLADTFAPEFEALRMDFNQSVEQLSQTLTSIAETANVMNAGTREIASSADDLAKRTEHQAASLEETAAAVEQITSNVANSTKRTDEASTIAKQANEYAKNSASVVAHAEDAMREIETSSTQISNIIGVIDEIAFQTNLLALNAGVEAARAGDAGKGFAVVAQEVRELAQRAAGAAKEIKSLIENSSSHVENGVKLVRDTSGALNAIGEFIVEINTHMQSIAMSSKEQSLGLQEVNQAVNSMDQTTQQNAAMVEESNAASTLLAQEAAKLSDLIKQFKLKGAASHQRGALQNAA